MGEREGLADAIAAVYPWAHRVAVVLCGDRERARDLVQDALAAAVRRPPEPLTEQVLRAWLRTVMTRMYLRRRERALLETRALSRLATRREREAPGWSEETERVRRALADLSPRQRACVALRYLEDLSEQQVAELLGLRLGTVKAHLAVARGKLRGTLGEPGGPAPGGGEASPNPADGLPASRGS